MPQTSHKHARHRTTAGAGPDPLVNPSPPIAPVLSANDHTPERLPSNRDCPVIGVTGLAFMSFVCGEHGGGDEESAADAEGGDLAAGDGAVLTGQR